jgi:hypothetical protein
MAIAFQNPAMLWASLFALVPLALHLFNLHRTRVVYFSGNMFLQKALSDTKKASRLKNILLLICRMLCIILLAAAFSKPFIPCGSAGFYLPGTVVYIDNSYSMSSGAGKGSCLDKAKSAAGEYIASAPRGAQIWVADNSGLVSRAPMDKSQAMEAVSGITYSGRASALSSAVYRAAGQTGGRANKVIAITDGQLWSTDIPMLSDSLLAVDLVMLSPVGAANVSIDSCWFENARRSPGSTEKLAVQINNHGNAIEEGRNIRLYVNDSLRAMTSVNLQPGLNTVEISYPNPLYGSVTVKAEIADQPVDFDNAYYLAYSVGQPVEVMHVGGELHSRAVWAMLAGRPGIIYTKATYAQALPEEIAAQSFVAVENIHNMAEGSILAIREFVSSGGSLLLIHRGEHNADAAAKLALLGIGIDSVGTVRAEVSSVAVHDDIIASSLKPVQPSSPYLGIIDNPVYFSFQGGKHRPLLSFSSGKPAFAAMVLGSGRIYTISAQLDGSSRDFVSNPVLVSLLYGAAAHSKPTVISTGNLGQDIKLPYLQGSQAELSDVGGQLNIAPEIRSDRFSKLSLLMPSSIIAEAGFYMLRSGGAQHPVAYNYSRQESVLEFMGYREAAKAAEKSHWLRIFDGSKSLGFQAAAMDAERGRLWKYLLVLVLLALAAEKLIAKFL